MSTMNYLYPILEPVHFDKVFAHAQPCKTENGHMIPAPWGPWVKDEETEMMIGTYCIVHHKGQRGESLDVEPLAGVLDFVREHMINIEYAKVYFEIVNGRLFAKYGSILGSRLICRIDEDTIPHQE